MRIRSFRRPREIDNLSIDEDVRRYFGGAFDQIEKITMALQGSLTPVNLDAQVRVVELKDDEAVRLGSLTVRGKIESVILVGTSRFDYARIAWRPVDRGEIEIRVKWDNSFIGPAEATVLILGGDL